MKILEPNTKEKVIFISKNSLYVSITDYNLKFLLKEIKIGPGSHIWSWMSLKEDSLLDLSEEGMKYPSFELSINKEVNNPYKTVYQFDTYEDLIENWNKIEYKDKIGTEYKEKKEF